MKRTFTIISMMIAFSLAGSAYCSNTTENTSTNTNTNTQNTVDTKLKTSLKIGSNSFHPDFLLLQANGEQWQTGLPYSEQVTCGQCHNSQSISNSLAAHHHGAPTQTTSLQPWLSKTEPQVQARHTEPQNTETQCVSCHAGNNTPLSIAVNKQGIVDAEKLNLTSPNSDACGACHGAVHTDLQQPFSLPALDQDAIFGITGETYVAQRISQSALNIENKNTLDFSFDIHAERVLSCADCHSSPNNPSSNLSTTNQTAKGHLRFDPRTLSAHDYLQQPNHNFEHAKSCSSCHNAEASHAWLPYFKQHNSKLSCESCHASWIAAPALKAINFDSKEPPQWRGVNNALVTGYKPWLLFNKQGKLAPFNIIDVTENGQTTTVAKPIHHNISVNAATRDCAVCHSENSALTKPLASLPANISDKNNFDENNTLKPWSSGVYVIGTNPLPIVDILGILLVLGTLGAVSGHGIARYLSWKKRGSSPHPRKSVYMYTFYERLWHWLQAALILLLMATGAAIHKPILFGWLSFPYMIAVHNILGFVLFANAALALFYHLASGKIKQFIPMPEDIFIKTYKQIQFYIQDIFKGAPHPFEKTPEQKLNPLQKMAYFGLLNALLPAQVLTGMCMWGAQHFPEAANTIGGLTLLGPLHSFLAWAFLAFLIMHIYLTTTSGPKPTSGIQSMISGWEDVELPNTEIPKKEMPNIATPDRGGKPHE